MEGMEGFGALRVWRLSVSLAEVLSVSLPEVRSGIPLETE